MVTITHQEAFNELKKKIKKKKRVQSYYGNILQAGFNSSQLGKTSPEFSTRPLEKISLAQLVIYTNSTLDYVRVKRVTRNTTELHIT